jgi:hypothetical protein
MYRLGLLLLGFAACTPPHESVALHDHRNDRLMLASPNAPTQEPDT